MSRWHFYGAVGGAFLGTILAYAHVKYDGAEAQSLQFPCNEKTWMFNGCVLGGAPHHVKTGDADMDRAVALCDAHRNTATNATPVWPEFEKDYDASCVVVMREWGASEAVKAAKERQAKAAADKAWLEGYAKGLKP